MRRFSLVISALVATLVVIAASPFLSSHSTEPLEDGIAHAQGSPPPSPVRDDSKGEGLPPALKPAVRFRDIATQAGLTTVPHSSSYRRYVLDTMAGGGIALFDCDNEGKLDIALVNDSTIDQYMNGGDFMITLYHQDPDSPTPHFTDITRAAGLTTKGWGMGIAVGDYDNDGLPDLYLTGYDHNVLYHNLGGCKFEDVTKKAGLEVGGFSTGAAWADYNGDGFLDLFVARYVHTDVHHLPNPAKSAGYKGVLVELPDTMEGETDFLFRNRGDGTFEDVSEKAGVNDPHKLHGMGVVWGDYDGDGWPDLFVTNDSPARVSGPLDKTTETWRRISVISIVTASSASSSLVSGINLLVCFGIAANTSWILRIRPGFPGRLLRQSSGGQDSVISTTMDGRTFSSPTAISHLQWTRSRAKLGMPNHCSFFAISETGHSKIFQTARG